MHNLIKWDKWVPLYKEVRKDGHRYEFESESIVSQGKCDSKSRFKFETEDEREKIRVQNYKSRASKSAEK